MIKITEQGKSGSLYEFKAGSLTFGCMLSQPSIVLHGKLRYGDMFRFDVNEAEQIALHLLSLVATVRNREGKEQAQ